MNTATCIEESEAAGTWRHISISNLVGVDCGSLFLPPNEQVQPSPPNNERIPMTQKNSQSPTIAASAGTACWASWDSVPAALNQEVLAWRKDAGVMLAMLISCPTEDGDEILEWHDLRSGESLHGNEPTHWMPLPDGPSECEHVESFIDMDGGFVGCLKCGRRL